MTAIEFQGHNGSKGKVTTFCVHDTVATVDST